MYMRYEYDPIYLGLLAKVNRHVAAIIAQGLSSRSRPVLVHLVLHAHNALKDKALLRNDAESVPVAQPKGIHLARPCFKLFFYGLSDQPEGEF